MAHFVVYAGIYDEETGARMGGPLPYASLTRAWAQRLVEREIDEGCADYAHVIRVEANGDRFVDRLPWVAPEGSPF